MMTTILFACSNCQRRLVRVDNRTGRVSCKNCGRDRSIEAASDPTFPWRFRHLRTGDTFDFVSGSGSDSFYLRCTKVSARGYVDETGTRHNVGSIDASVYHVQKTGVTS